MPEVWEHIADGEIERCRGFIEAAVGTYPPKEHLYSATHTVTLNVLQEMYPDYAADPAEVELYVAEAVEDAAERKLDETVDLTDTPRYDGVGEEVTE